jgi:murein DD-endopeptidase MepM/ murein hydrolase activator NlpD
LSAYGKGIKSGVSVAQGQVVGYVGSTGWSTGPHLDYGMKLNGAPINPLSLKLPKGTPLGGSDLEKFQETKRKYDDALR